MSELKLLCERVEDMGGVQLTSPKNTSSTVVFPDMFLHRLTVRGNETKRVSTMFNVETVTLFNMGRRLV